MTGYTIVLFFHVSAAIGYFIAKGAFYPHFPLTTTCWFGYTSGTIIVLAPLEATLFQGKKRKERAMRKVRAFPIASRLQEGQKQLRRVNR
jgi:hypothetical protein